MKWEKHFFLKKIQTKNDKNILICFKIFIVPQTEDINCEKLKKKKK